MGRKETPGFRGGAAGRNWLTRLIFKRIPSPINPNSSFGIESSRIPVSLKRFRYAQSSCPLTTTDPYREVARKGSPVLSDELKLMIIAATVVFTP